MGLGEGEGDHVADVMADHVGALDVQRVHHPGDVFGLVLFGEAIRGDSGKPHAAQVRRDHRVVAHEIGRQRRPHVAGVAIAMDQHHGRACAANADMQDGPVGRDVLSVEAGRKVEGLGQRRRCGEERQCRRRRDHPIVESHGHRPEWQSSSRGWRWRLVRSCRFPA